MDEGFHRVLVTADKRKLIATQLNCSKQQISNALVFANNGLLSRKIRSYAINVLKCPVI